MAILDNNAGTAGTQQTLNAYDQIQATGSNNTVTLVDVAGGSYMTAAQVSGIQTLNIRSGGAVGATKVENFDVSGWTGLTAVNVTQSTGNDFLKVGANTAVTVNDTAGKVTVSGGSTQTVNTAGGVALSGATGAITVVDTAQAGEASTIDGGTNVTLTSTATNPGLTTGTITVGNTTKPTGTVTITDNLTNAAAAGGGANDTTGGLITVNGGTTVSVTETATQAARATGDNAKIIQGDITVNGSSLTTSVTATQAAAIAAVTGVAAANEVDTLSFGAGGLKAGQTVNIGGLSFQAGHTAVTQAQLVAAFANLANGATTGAGTAYGTYSGALTGFSSGSAAGTSVVFTSATGSATAIAVSSPNGTVADIVTVAPVSGDVAVAGVGGVDNGAVLVVDANFAAGTTAGTITTVTVNNYSTLRIDDNNLSTLSAKAGGNITINNNSLMSTAPAKTLALTLDTVGTALADAVVDDADVYTTLNVTTANGNSYVDILGLGGLTTLAVSGTKTLNSMNGVAATLATVTVTGSAAITGDFSAMAATSSITASGTSGNNTVTIDPRNTSYLGGTGEDVVTTSNSTISKSISLGNGDDKLVLASGTTTLGALVSGGLGIDILDMDAADAETASGNAAFVTKISGFETLGIKDLAGAAVAVDVAMLGMAGSLVIEAGAGAGTAANNVFNNFASGGTITINDTDNTAGNGVTLANTEWTTPTTDTLKVVMNDASVRTNAFEVVTSGIESVTVTSQGASAGTAVAQVLELTDASTTSVTINGASALTLTATGAALKTINAASATGGLTIANVDTGTSVTSITGSATAANSLVAHTAGATDVAVTLTGGSGNDILTANSGMDVINVGTGYDTVVVQIANTLSNQKYTTVNGIGAGDILSFKDLGSVNFTATAISLAPTATFQNYLDAASTSTAATTTAIKWFQFDGNTYVVSDLSTDATFKNGTDIVVALTGTIDLSHSALTAADVGTLLIG